MDTPVPMIARTSIDDVEPAKLSRIRADIAERLPEVREAVDRRGFRLQHWSPGRPNAAGKPIELSFEHEARLRPREPAAIRVMQAYLAERTGLALFPGTGPDDRLTVQRLHRAPGFQSVDRYWDIGGRVDRGVISRMGSLRQRIRTSKFMTWSDDDESANGVFNLELPLVALGTAGVVARLEFNWIDHLAPALTEFQEVLAGKSVDPRNPLALALSAGLGDLRGVLAPALEHTTFREKYLLIEAAGAASITRFQLNIDHIVVQSLASRLFAHHIDVDLAASVPVDAAVVQELNWLAQRLSERFGLTPANAPKAWWGAQALGELPSYLDEHG